MSPPKHTQGRSPRPRPKHTPKPKPKHTQGRSPKPKHTQGRSQGHTPKPSHLDIGIGGIATLFTNEVPNMSSRLALHNAINIYLVACGACPAFVPEVLAPKKDMQSQSDQFKMFALCFNNVFHKVTKGKLMPITFIHERHGNVVLVNPDIVNYKEIEKLANSNNCKNLHKVIGRGLSTSISYAHRMLKVDVNMSHPSMCKKPMTVISYIDAPNSQRVMDHGNDLLNSVSKCMPHGWVVTIESELVDL
jgi:hypothetical protein